MSEPLPVLIGASEAFAAFRARLERTAHSDATVLVTGESGTGKELAAEVLHAASPRRHASFVRADLGGLAPTLAEATLFGHEKGAFTDAKSAREGLFRRAHGGTLLLDDVHLLAPAVQVKLLRVLQERCVEPLGAEATVSVDVRLVATTSQDLAAEVRAGRFRGDLYWRLAVVALEIPPLRVRKADIRELAEHLLPRVAARLKVPERALAPAALERLLSHAWPGNVRELENALERVLALPESAGAAIEAAELEFLNEAVASAADDLARAALRHGLSVEEVTRAMLERSLAEHRGNVSAAARAVGLTRRAFDYRLVRRSDGGAGA
jgi:DNA-binding NtrC family response regulator